jgi:hypothetical protein
VTPWEMFQLLYFATAMACVLLVYIKTKHWLPTLFVAIMGLAAGVAAGLIA